MFSEQQSSEPPAALPTDGSISSNPRDDLSQMVSHLAHLLPSQGPIGVFIHHNTLHAFQQQKFEDAVVQAAKLFATEPYLTEDGYRKSLASGRILAEDIEAVLKAEDHAQPLLNGATSTLRLRHQMLLPGTRSFRPETIAWEIEEGELLNDAKSRELFEFCWQQTPQLKPIPQIPVRPRDGVRSITGIDLDEVVHPLLIKLCSAFLDQGLAYWPMPNRADGFWKASLNIVKQPLAFSSDGLRLLPGYVQVASNQDSLDALLQAMETLGVPPAQQEQFLLAELLALPGWAGMMSRLEQEPELAPHHQLPATLVDFLAVRMLLTVAATDAALGGPRKWRQEIITPKTRADALRLARAATYFDVARTLRLSVEALRAAAQSVPEFFQAIDTFDDWERRRVWHLAYERRHERMILLPLLTHSRQGNSVVPDRLTAQVFFCLDEREESMRRQLEELDPEIETFSTAGFYGVAMSFQGMDDAHASPLCPVVVKPKHAVRERAVSGYQDAFARRAAFRKQWAGWMREWSIASRTLVRGWLGTAVLGALNIAPLAARVLSPRHYGNLINWINAAVVPEPQTELAFNRSDEAGHHDGHALGQGKREELLKGFSLIEKVDRVAGILFPAGLHRGMARLVITLGHGSTSLNNPHESAHDCGACGGFRGGPNGRVFAAMANLPEVRAALRERDILIPDDTWFVGGYHDTCNDDLDLYDLDAVPKTHKSDLARVRASLDKARALNARERARRFEAAAWGVNAAGALQHMQERSEHLAEPRPEYGHASNAVCIIGKRANTRGLFLDRRAFLISYDQALDPENRALAALLGAAIPVCAGINLEYYFSAVDNEGYGCGTKLPHNVTGLLGIMNGAESDLRTGLPWQMVEIHEPVRCLFVLETTRERALETLRGNPVVWEFLEKRWIRLAVQDPTDHTIHVYQDGSWEPIEGDDVSLPVVASSHAWYAGHREHLGIARIGETKTQDTKHPEMVNA